MTENLSVKFKVENDSYEEYLKLEFLDGLRIADFNFIKMLKKNENPKE